jgi:hypothetical protein
MERDKDRELYREIHYVTMLGLEPGEAEKPGRNSGKAVH